jgi:type IV pilus assembly protein PilB
VNISTAEDPVEYQLDGINQVQCKPDIGLTFATALRSFLRQDPDIIMVGEIRDKETAEIGIKAALTGHLVLSTLHTNDSLSSIERLENMGIESFLIAASLNMVIAQRLVRKICSRCKVDDTEYRKKLKILKINPEKIDGKSEFKIGKGCKFCNGTGYKGRTIIYEILVIDENIKRLILKNNSSLSLRKFRSNKGMNTLKESGIKKASKGITSLDEILRVTTI